MNTHKILISILKKSLVLIILVFSGCNDFLKEEVYTQYDPKTFLQDQSGVDALLTGAYSRSRIIEWNHRNYTYIMNEFTTDIAFETGGGLERAAAPFIQFNWAVNTGMLNGSWNAMYRAITSANTVISVLNGLDGVSDELLKKIEAEGRFIRASSYYFLYNLFGPTPIVEIPADATVEEIEEIGKSTPRSSKEGFVNYLVADLTFAADYLPVEENPLGRATKGAALAVLTKLYLMEKNWSKVVETSDRIINLGYYELYNDYTKLFSVEGESNKEFIYRVPCIPQAGFSNVYIPHAFPPGYPIQSNWENFGAQFRTYTSFYKTFEENDIRRDLILTNYVNVNGVPVELVEDASGEPLDNARSLKYLPDPEALGRFNGNDIVYVRYADILMCKAEALNELNGPSNECFALLNQVRSRAGLGNISSNDYSTKGLLRDYILADRAREFYSEGLRREDLIRHNKYISGGQSRGYNAQDYQVLFPIPQNQIDANPNLEQNPGY